MSELDGTPGTHRSTFEVWPSLQVAKGLAPGRRHYAQAALLSAIVAGILAVPPVAAALGVPATHSVALVGGYVALLLAIALIVDRHARTSVKWRVAINVADLIGAHVVCVGLAIATHNPVTGLWCLAIMHAAANASEKLFMSPSWAVLSTHALAPLVAIPVFLHNGLSPSSAVGGPLLFSVLCGVIYFALADRTRILIQVVAERDELRERLRRADLARELHDGVGSSLTLASMYADQLGDIAADPALQQLAASLAATTRSGLRELRVALEEIKEESFDARQLEAVFRARSTGPYLGGLVIEVTSVAGSVPIGARGCAVLLRIFQEALQNCIRHASATRFTVTLDDAAPERTLLLLEDNGRGFDQVGARRSGLDHMRVRAEEVGGNLTIASEHGTQIRVELPRGA